MDGQKIEKVAAKAVAIAGSTNASAAKLTGRHWSGITTSQTS